MSPLDAAHAAMTAAPDDEAARLAYFGVLADSALWLWLEVEPGPGDGALSPQVFQLPEGPAVLAFDSAGRLAEVAGEAAYAELPGRVVAQALAGQGVALGVNLGAEAPAFLVPPGAVDWLATLVTAVPEGSEAAGAVAPPGTVPDVLVRVLEARLRGLAQGASMVRLDGSLTLVLTGAQAEEVALARAAGEAAAFAALDEPLAVAFAAPGSPLAASVLRRGVPLDVAAPATPEPSREPAPEPPRAPGSDPSRPPRLR
jgi:SseB protein N-terminal domain